MTRRLSIPAPDWKFENWREEPISLGGMPMIMVDLIGFHPSFALRIPPHVKEMAGPNYDGFHLIKRLEAAYARTVENFLCEMEDAAERRMNGDAE